MLVTHAGPSACTGLQRVHIPEETCGVKESEGSIKGGHRGGMQRCEGRAGKRNNTNESVYVAQAQPHRRRDPIHSSFSSYDTFLKNLFRLSHDIIRQISPLRARGRSVLKPTSAVEGGHHLPLKAFNLL